MPARTTMDLMLNASMVSDRLKKQMADMTDLWAGLMTKANKSVFTVKQIRGLEKVAKDYEKAMESAVLQVNAAEKRFKKNRKDQEAKDIIALGKERIKQLKAESQARVLAESTIIDKRQALADKYAKNFGEELDRNIFSVQKAEDFGESIGGAFADVSSMELKNWAGLVKKLGQFSGRQGARADVAAVGKEGAGGKALAGLGKALGGIGKALMVAAGAFAIIAAVAKVIMDADAATKELNRSLLDAGVAGADLADSYGMVSDAIDNTRISFSKAIKFNHEWGTTAKDNLEILGKYAEAGLTFKEITKGTQDAAEQMEYLQKATEHALIYSKLLGKSAEEVAQDSATAMEDFGLTLKGVAEQFSTIIGYAKESGFATKRFYGMIQQATSGMSMYNIRLSEASELLIQLGKTLGQDLAQDYLDGLTKGFKDESTQDRVKKSMTTGVQFTLDILRQGAVKAAEDFQHALANFGKDNGDAFWEAIGRGIGGVSGEEAKGMSPEKLARAMQKMSTTDRAKMMTEAGAIDPALTRQLGGLFGKSQAFGKGLGAAQAAREYAGPAETLVLGLNELQRVLGKRVDQIDMTNIQERMAWENITGIQGEAARKMFEIGQHYNGLDASIKEAIEAGKKNPEAIDKWNKKYQEKFGVQIDEATGKVYKWTKDMSTGNFERGAEIDVGKGGANALILALGDKIGETVGATLSQDQQTALEIAENTRDMAHIQEVGMTALLEEINGAVQWIVSHFSGGNSEARKEAQDVISAKLETSRRGLLSLGGQKRDLRQSLAKDTLSPEDRAKKEAELQALEEKIRKAEEEQTRLREVRREVHKAKGETVEEVIAGAEGLSAGYAMERLSPEEQQRIKEEAARRRAPALAAAQQRDAEVTAGLTNAPGATGIAQLFMAANAISKYGENESAVPTMDEYINDEIRAMKGQDRLIKDGSKDQVEATGKVEDAVEDMSQFFEQQSRMNITQALAGSSAFTPEQIPAIAARLAAGESLAGMGLNADQLNELKNRGIAHDMVMQMGNGRVKFAQRVDNADTVAVSKPGGALSKIGGGVTNIFHLYNDGHGVMRAIEKAQKAGLMRG